MYNHLDQIVGAYAALSRMLAEGRLKSAETIVRGGFERWAECVDRVTASQTFGRGILAIDRRRRPRAGEERRCPIEQRPGTP